MKWNYSALRSNPNQEILKSVAKQRFLKFLVVLLLEQGA
jgi:hypothetical protein